MRKAKFFIPLLFLLIPHQTAFSGTYAQLSNNADQVATADTVNRGMAINLQVIDGISGVQWDPKTDKLTFKEDGIYFIMSTIQAGGRESATNIIKGGDIYFWLELNGTPVADSGSWTFASPSSRAKTIVDQMVIPIKQNDTLRFMYASSAPSMGVLSFPADNERPSSPGASITLFKIDGK